MEISCVKEVEQNPLPKSQTKPFYIGTKEAPSDKQEKLFVSLSSTIRLKRQAGYEIITTNIY